MKKGFTLAEILIALTIIGVIAMLTIPNLISSYKQSEYKTGLKKAVAAITEAIKLNYQQDNETPYDAINMYRGLDTFLKKNLSVSRTGTIYSPTGAQTGETYQNEVFYTDDGMIFNYKTTSEHTFKLHESETYIPLGWTGGNYDMYRGCGSFGLNKTGSDTANPPCIIVVDVNGYRGPSNSGNISCVKPGTDCEFKDVKYTAYPAPDSKLFIDIFPIMITENQVLPFGTIAQRAMYSK